MRRTISFTLNGKPQRLAVSPDRKLLWVLRTDLGLTGTKFGCGHGLCGACTVAVDGQPARACLLDMNGVAGKDVLTIEGLGSAERLDPLQEAFVTHQAFQCGFCTSGMLMAAHALLLAVPAPTEAEIVARLDRNLCRCGAHGRIVAAVAATAKAKGGTR